MGMEWAVCRDSAGLGLLVREVGEVPFFRPASPSPPAASSERLPSQESYSGLVEQSNGLAEERWGQASSNGPNTESYPQSRPKPAHGQPILPRPSRPLATVQGYHAQENNPHLHKRGRSPRRVSQALRLPLQVLRATCFHHG